MNPKAENPCLEMTLYKVGNQLKINQKIEIEGANHGF